MKFFIENKEIDDTVREIRKKIRLSMNGEVSASMTQRGLKYKRNFGVNIPRIKEISQNYSPNHDLASRLWALKIRETMILATLLQPLKKFSKKDAEEWMEAVDQTELAEQISMNLFSKLPFATELALDLINSDKMWNQIVGFMVIARVWKTISEEELLQILNRSVELSASDELHLYKSISLALSRLCRKDEYFSKLILKKISGFDGSDLVSQKYIFSEIKNEVDFMNI